MVDDNSVLDCLVVKKGAAALTGGTLKAMQKELELADEKVKHTPCRHMEYLDIDHPLYRTLHLSRSMKTTSTHGHPNVEN